MKQEPAGPRVDLETAPREAAHRAERLGGLRQRYLALIWRARLSAVAFWTAMAFFLAWAIPWIPSGLSLDDYTREVAATFILAATSLSLGGTALLLRRRAQKTQEALIAWSTMYDDTTGLYNRRYFFDRLALECDRAKVHGTPFAVVLLRFEHVGTRRDVAVKSSESDLLRTAANEVRRRIRSTDAAALLSGNQLVVLLGKVNDELAKEAAARLVRFVREALPTQAGVSVRFGLSSYGNDGTSPNALLRAAERDLKGRAQTAEGLDQAPQVA